MKVLLFNPRSSAGRKPVLPMSLLAVAAVLEGDRELKIVDGNLDHDPVGTLDGLIGAGAADTLLGVTVMPGPQLEEAVPVCRELKRRHPALTIVWGGYFPSQHWDACLRSSPLSGAATFRASTGTPACDPQPSTSSSVATANTCSRTS